MAARAQNTSPRPQQPRTAPASGAAWRRRRRFLGPRAAAPVPRSAPGTFGSGTCCSGWASGSMEGAYEREMGASRFKDGTPKVPRPALPPPGGERPLIDASASTSAPCPAAPGLACAHRLVPWVGSLTGSRIISLLLAMTCQQSINQGDRGKSDLVAVPETRRVKRRGVRLGSRVDAASAPRTPSTHHRHPPRPGQPTMELSPLSTVPTSSEVNSANSCQPGAGAERGGAGRAGRWWVGRGPALPAGGRSQHAPPGSSSRSLCKCRPRRRAAPAQSRQ